MTVVLLSSGMLRGGAETQVARLAAELRRRGWQAEVVSLRGNPEFEGVHAPGLAGMPALLRRLRPAILHCHLYHANVAGRLLRLLLPVPVVISTLHSLAESSRRSPGTRGRDFVYRLTDRLADRTVAVSPAVAARHIAARALSPARAAVIPNGVDIELYHPDPARPERERFLWLAAGRLMWKKDFATLLKAFALLGRGELWIAGAGPEESALREQAPPGVKFLGRRNDMPELLRSADGFVLSSVVEGLPLVLLEAAASGTPAVAADTGGVRDAEPAFLVPPSDPEKLAAAMSRLMEMPAQERRELGLRARRRAAERFAWPVVVEQWERLYRELLRWT